MIIAIICLIVGIVIGFVGGYFIIRNNQKTVNAVEEAAGKIVK